MDKYAVYVIVVYVVTLILLGVYLSWLWLRLRAVRDEASLNEQAGVTRGSSGPGSSRPDQRG